MARPQHLSAPPLAATMAVVAVGVIHRGAVLALHLQALDALAVANSDWYPFQFLPSGWLRDHLLASLWYLQQEPPITNLMFGLILKTCSWPVGVARALVALQGALSIVSAIVLLRVLCALYPRRWLLATAASIVFLLGTDLIVMEYYSQGQIFYESVSMLLAISAIYTLVGLATTGRLRWSIATGLVVASMALTRSTWSFLALPALGLVLLAAPRPRRRHAVCFLLPVLVLHGGWSVKNRIVYGRWMVATSSWGGAHALLGLSRTGLGQDFARHIAASNAARPHQPAWFVSLFPQDPPSEEGLKALPFVGQWVVPPEIRAQDAAIEARLGGEPVPWNRLAGQLLFAELQKSFLEYILHAPRAVLGKTARAYEVFWRPIRYYPAMFIALFRVEELVPRGEARRHIARRLVRGDLVERQYVTGGKWPHLGRRETSLWTLRWLDWPLDVACLVGVHVALPLLAVLWLVHRLRSLRTQDPVGQVRGIALVAAVTMYVYLALLSSLVEYGENMRYRFSIEPVIWLIATLSIAEGARLVWLLLAARSTTTSSPEPRLQARAVSG